MKLRHLIQFIVFLVSLLLIINNASAQMSSEFWITVQSDTNAKWGYEPWELSFGNHINGTYGIDSLNPTLREIVFPPMAPGFAACWAYIPGRPNIWGENGKLYKYDFRGIPLNSLQVDTFNLMFAHAGFGDADITIRWPKAEYLAQRCDSMFMIDKYKQLPVINAFAIDSIVIPDALDRMILYLFIYKYGCKIIDNVNEENGIVPTTFLLNQNFPNPLNPSTQITFSVPKATSVILKIYDVLGREVAILVNERRQAGDYNITWNAEGVSSGVYFYRIVAGDFIETKKMVVVR
jgi:hypothetical protein